MAALGDRQPSVLWRHSLASDMNKLAGGIEPPATDAFFARVSPFLGAAPTGATIESVEYPVQQVQACDDAQGGNHEGFHRSKCREFIDYHSNV